MANSRQPNQNFTIREDRTATSLVPPPRQQDNAFVLRNMPNHNGQWVNRFIPPTVHPFPVGQWMNQHTQPNDPRSHAALFSDPQALARAQNTVYYPQGDPMVVTP
jgi:hypothetical protein